MSFSRNYDRNDEGEVCLGYLSEISESDVDYFNCIRSQQKRKSDLRKRHKPYKWHFKDTQMFYTALRKYGANMELIAKEINIKCVDRNVVKLKFKYEQKANSLLIQSAMRKSEVSPIYFGTY
ncbi:hypothetical protein EIN_223710 [Entamoeba invadens IP1]|uniref:Transcription factor TFIIIB component B'' Myb domain-containing protein n=1 Tax=Entamoeba invadens IP1 TaxID=370355 RepID=A0A0A1U856_ENTIV|nr:hypothetical protein EIN_223710 [Entamoeba invadens IP1]ELP88158.1 hypothetical protein EIN_223710 [Entamoeba invadens IP1]|eukprot:XP_004254929.1 hypothetical protein EIN_223710 [Entamoeba invadens IP1]